VHTARDQQPQEEHAEEREGEQERAQAERANGGTDNSTESHTNAQKGKETREGKQKKPEQ